MISSYAEMSELEVLKAENEALNEVVGILKKDLDKADDIIQKKNIRIAYLNGIVKGAGIQ